MMTTSSPSSSSSFCQWSAEENKLFENALAEFDDEDAPHRWEKVVAWVPRKMVAEKMWSLPLPHYPEDNNGGGNGVARKEEKRRGEKKKSVPWNEEEHRSLSMLSMNGCMHACWCFDDHMNNAAEEYIHQSEMAIIPLAN
ncbi:hypothetical protein ACLOJK_041902 [Asimina triloba]